MQLQANNRPSFFLLFAVFYLLLYFVINIQNSNLLLKQTD